MLTKGFFNAIARGEDFFHGAGSFGVLMGRFEKENGMITLLGDGYRLSSRVTENEEGVFLREDTFENVSEEQVTLSSLASRFVFDGGEYEVYTQFNAWQNESAGAWQPLVTTVEAASTSNRTALGAAPFVALWSAQEGRGVAFHLLPNSAWRIRVKREFANAKYTRVAVELGFAEEDLRLCVAPGECIALPRILCYEFKNRTDMDAYKLHTYMHAHYPRRSLPIIYNSWLYRFDRFTADDILAQIPLAAELGAEYFVIDAGWFGKGELWTVSVGDWSENLVTGFAGRMGEVADAVRAHGMKFGLWIEFERAHAKSDAIRDHEEYYVIAREDKSVRFFDFANPEARAWMLDTVSGLIDKYGVAYIKNDNNVDMQWDPRHAGYYEYHKGRDAFVDALRAKYPDLYLTSCASGGEQMELANYTHFDSTWPSDNESPYVEMDIYKASLLRLPPQGFERWVAVHSLKGTEDFYRSFADGGFNEERLVACGDAVWKQPVGVALSYLKGYMTGGPIGFSTDLTMLSDAAFAEMRAHVASIKKDRAFWRTVTARILCDTPTVTVYQYSDTALARAEIRLFTGKTKQTGFRVYPVLDPERVYTDGNGRAEKGSTWMYEGISLISEPVWRDNWYEMLEFTLIAE